MDFSKIPIYSLISRKMSWLTQRQNVLAQNIANADTPNFQPRDLSKASFRNLMEGQGPRMQMQQTSAAHMQPTINTSEFRASTAKSAYESALSGNSVVLEEQLMKVSETQDAYRLATNLYSKHVAMMKMAIGRGR
jgi:flagellar basal-body rod protein FlgB